MLVVSGWRSNCNCSDLQECVASDWQQQPTNFLPNLTAAAAAGDANTTKLLQFGRDVHNLWRVLCRQVGVMFQFMFSSGDFSLVCSLVVLVSLYICIVWFDTALFVSSGR
jgi:hypothetical protein